MIYVLAPQGVVQTYPYSVLQLRKDHPDTSFPRTPSSSLLAQYDVFSVIDTHPPEFDPLTETLTEGTPEQINGAWRRVWHVTQAAPEEVEQRLEARRAEAARSRADAYRNEADLLFFKAQRGEATMEEWLSLVEDIRQRHP